MSFGVIKSAARYLCYLSALVVVVVLLTIPFNFLGTISSAVLTGMVLGATKHQRWQAIPVGFVFPAVTFALLHWAKDDFLGRQTGGLSLLCLGAFWLPYAVTSLLIYCEAKSPASAAVPEVAAVVTPPSDSGLQVELTAALAPQPTLQLTLADLDGQWSQAILGSDSPGQEKRIEISGGKVVLRLVHSDGRVQMLAQGRLDLATDGPAQRSDISAHRAEF